MRNKHLKILITGGAGFIGSQLLKKLTHSKYEIIAIDNFNDYYDVNLKYDRLIDIGFNEDDVKVKFNDCSFKNIKFYDTDITEVEKLNKLFETYQFDMVINLAAQAGVRNSLENPRDYIESNILGFFNIIEACKEHHVANLLFASSSSVYGNSENIPFTPNQNTDEPISVYAATKKANELLAHTYAHLYKMNCIGLRFFTVYGPWGRPDMAYYKFTKRILEGKPIDVYNNGNLSRDFTYIDDITKTLEILISKMSNPSEALKFKILNIGNGSPVGLKNFIHVLEEQLKKKAIMNNMEMQEGDVLTTFSDTSDTIDYTGYSPSFSIESGVELFVDWYKAYHAK